MRSITATIVLVTILGLASEAIACRCLPPPPPKEALNKAEAVFSGKVVNIQQQGTKVFVEVEVKELWKLKANKKTVKIETNTSSCGWRFKVGESYLFYADAGMKVHLCTRTQVLQNATADLKQLGPGKPPAKA